MQDSGLCIVVTKEIALVLEKVLDQDDATEEVKCKAKDALAQSHVSWRFLASIVQQLRASSKEKQLWLHRVCLGSKLYLPEVSKAPRSPELVKRLEKIQAKLDQQEYDRMVADITVDERAAEERRKEILPNYRLQMTFGAHVIVTMGAFYAMAYYASRLVGASEVWALLCGVLGLTFGMLLETILLITRSNMPATPPLWKKLSAGQPKTKAKTRARLGNVNKKTQ